MACYSVRKDGKHIGFVCGDLGEHCRECGAVSDNLCDYPVGDGKTCDRSLCEEHSKQVGLDIHYCPTHAKHWEKFKRSGGVQEELKRIEGEAADLTNNFPAQPVTGSGQITST